MLIQNPYRVIGYFGLLFIMVGVVSSAWALNDQAVVMDEVAGVVNNEVILRSQVEHELELLKRNMPHDAPAVSQVELQQQVMAHLIEEQLQMQQVALQHIEVSEQDVTQAIEQIASRNGSTVDALQKKVTAEFSNWDEYRQRIKTDLLFNNLHQIIIVPRVHVSEQAVRTFFRAEQDKHHEYHIVDTWLTDEGLRASGGDLSVAAEVVTRALQADSTKLPAYVEHADLNWRKRADIPYAYQSLVRTMKDQEVSGVIKMANGHHIIKRLGVRYGLAPKTLDEAGVQLRNQAFTEALQKWLAELRAAAYIRVQI